MATRPLRYSGEFPPADTLRQYPNWEYAHDEENNDDQDETTIRPAAEQDFIGSSAVFVSGFAIQADGNRLVVMLDLIENVITGLTALINDDWAWAVRKTGRTAKWQSMTFDWIPEEARPPSVGLDDPDIFPLRVETDKPTQKGVPLREVIALQK